MTYDNRKFWDELAEIHVLSEYYDVPGFLKNPATLRDIERSFLGCVDGSSILHLQCHLGLDSISLNKLGASVTAVDFSPRAIEIARSLADKTGATVRFVHGDIRDLKILLTGYSFDIAFASYGVLAWLDSLEVWANNVYDCLKPGGRLILVDDHPFARTLSGSMAHGADYYMAPTFPYENDGIGIRVNFRRSYANSKAVLRNQDQIVWAHSISEILNSVISAGLVIRRFQEYFKSTYKMFSAMEKRSDGWWYLVECAESIPLTFALLAEKPCTGL